MPLKVQKHSFLSSTVSLPGCQDVFCLLLNAALPLAGTTHSVSADLPGCTGPQATHFCIHLAVGRILQPDVACPGWTLRCNLPFPGSPAPTPGGVQPSKNCNLHTGSHLVPGSWVGERLTPTTDSPAEWAETLPTWGRECCCHAPPRFTMEPVCLTPKHPGLRTPQEVAGNSGIRASPRPSLPGR